MPSVQRSAVTQQIAENIAREFISEVPVSQIAQKWGFSRKTVDRIRKGDHPALSEKTQQRLFKLSTKKQKQKIRNLPTLSKRPDVGELARQNLQMRTMLVDLFKDTLSRIETIQKTCA